MEHGNHLQTRWVELVLAAFFAAIGLVVISDSLRVGREWGSEGPQPGYFPFYVGCLLVAGACWVAFQTLARWRSPDEREAVFATHSEFRRVLSMLLPSTAYVLGVVLIGIYVSSAVFTAAFMVWQGRYPISRACLTGLVVSTLLFILFELWFLVQLPKGPLETLLGF